MSQKSDLEKLKGKKVTLAPNTALEAAIQEKRRRDAGEETPAKVNATENTDENRADLTQAERTTNPEPTRLKQISEVPRRFKSIMQQDEALSQEGKANIQTYQYLITEFNHLRNYAKAKNQKTSVTTMISNILHEYLDRNADELEKVFGYRPFKK